MAPEIDPFDWDLFCKIHKGLLTEVEVHFNMLLLILSGPEALFTFNISRIDFTSLSMIRKMFTKY